MGIKLLSSFIKSFCKDKDIIVQKHLSCFYGKTFTIDTSIYMYRYKCEGELIEKMYLLCNTLNYYNINAIFVFDGKTPVEKINTILIRKEERKQATIKLKKIESIIDNSFDKNIVYNKYKNDIIELKRKSTKINRSDIDNVKKIIKYMGLSYVVAEEEAEQLCAELVLNKLAFGCLSEDTDLFVYMCPHVLRYISLANHKLIFYDTKKILNHLSLTKQEFITICLLSGNDYYAGSKNIYYYYKMMIKYKKYIDKNISFINWLKQKNIINDDIIDDYNNNLKMYKVNKLDHSKYKFQKKNPDFENLKDILIQDNFIFP